MDEASGLESVFTDSDLARLREGKRLVSGAQADPEVVYLLTDNREARFRSALGEAYGWAVGLDSDAEHDYGKRLRGEVRSRRGFLQVAGELMVGRFLTAQLSFACQRIRTHTGRRADFLIAKGGHNITVEVKTAVGGIEGPPLNAVVGGLDVEAAKAVRGLVKAAVRQLHPECHNLVALVNWRRPPLSCDLVLDALFGRIYLAIPVGLNASAAVPSVRRDSSGKLKRRLNTRVGVVGVFGGAQPGNAGACFIHNPYATLSVSPELLDPCPQLVVSAQPGVLESRNARIEDWHTA